MDGSDNPNSKCLCRLMPCVREDLKFLCKPTNIPLMQSVPKLHFYECTVQTHKSNLHLECNRARLGLYKSTAYSHHGNKMTG